MTTTKSVLTEVNEERSQYKFKATAEDLYKFVKENKPEVDLFDGNSSRFYDLFKCSFFQINNRELLAKLENCFDLNKTYEVSFYSETNHLIIRI